jgi:hypothetical protein
MTPAADCRDDNHEPLALDLLLTEDQRRTVTPEVHQAFRESISTSRPFDEIDELIQLDPYAGDPPSKRSDKETDRLLSILDSLDERGNG